MILTLLLIALGFVAGVTLAMFLDRQESREKDRLLSAMTALEYRQYARWQREKFDLETEIIRIRAELAAARFEARPTEGKTNEAKLNPESFLSGLNEDMRKALQREEIEAKIEAYRNSSSTASLHEYIGISEAELYAFLEQDEASGIIEKLPDEDRTHPGEPA